MSMPCANTYYLNQYQAKVDAEEGAARFIEEYVTSRIEDRIIENAREGDVLEAASEEMESIMEAYRPLLRAFHSADMGDKAELTADQELAMTRFAWTFLKRTKDYIRANADDELTEEAKKAMQQAKERANCSCRRTGRECVC